MARVNIDKRSGSGKKSELTLQVTQTQSGHNYSFRLHGNHVEVLKQGQTPAGDEWYNDLTADEKLEAFNRILAEYRKRAMGASGVKVASLGVTEEGRIYISENSEQLSDDFHRQCAEQSMVTISSQRELYRQISDRDPNDHDEDFEVRYPRFKSVYLMGGRDNKSPNIICPCGNCTDLLAKVMDPEAPVYVLPINDGTAKLEINDQAHSTDELNPNQVWKTTIGYLNHDREIGLDTSSQEMQRKAFDKVAYHISEVLNKERKSKQIENMTDHLLEHLKREIATNPTPDRINKLQVAHIEMRLLDQVRYLVSKENVTDVTPETVKELIQKNIKHVRSVAVELDNGRVFTGLAVNANDKSALPAAEVAAVQAAEMYLGSSGVRRAQVLEFNPGMIEKGAMSTSPKLAIERLVKHRSVVTGTVKLDYVPFNDGNIKKKELSEKTKNYDDAKQLYPGFFVGKNDVLIKAKLAEQVIQQSKETGAKR